MDFSKVTQDWKTLDAKKVGLKSGIEIHQQLATAKLFCNCPSEIREDKPHFCIKRQLRASAGESGKVDQAALAETRKQKSFLYQGYHDTTCLVELDEEPPWPVNADALSVATQVASMLKSTTLEHVQVMRKTVVDGSNTSGFQRTMLLGVGGEISGNFGKAGIEAVCLEEDSAKVIERGSAQDTYNLSRLGIPLIEIASAPDLTSPEMIRDAAAHIGLILRSTRAVKRGLGTIRQDVNISVTGGARVEIKGAQDLKLIPELVRKEMARQVSLLELKKIFPKKMSTGKPIEVTKEFNGAKGFIGKLIAKGSSVVGISLAQLSKILGLELYQGYRLGTELAGYAKANGFGGIIHDAEEETKYGVSFATIAQKLGAKNTDGWFVLVGDQQKINALITSVLIPRLQQITHGVPSEVRKANEDGTTTYLRPMPGAARMYPETDIPIVHVPRNITVPKLLTEQITDFAKKYSLSEVLAKEAIELPAFEEFVAAFPKLTTQVIAHALITTPKEIAKRENIALSDEKLLSALKTIFAELSKGTMPKEAIYELLVTVGKGKKLDFSKYKLADAKEVEKVVDAVVAKDPSAPIGALMGQAMAQLRGKADGKLVMGLLQNKLKK